MKKLIVFGSICLAISNVSAQEIATAIKQNDASKLQASVLLYPDCSYFYQKNMSAVTNHALITCTAGQTIKLYGIDIHSLDTVNQGLVFFQNEDNSEFYPGYLATAPSAFGTQLNYTVQGLSLKVTTSGATGIVLHYKIVTN